MQSVQVAANSSNLTSMTTLSIPLRCHGNATAGLVSCGIIEARLLRVWNSRSHVDVAISGQRFTATADGGGVLSLTLGTRLAGIYALELASFGARDQLFLRMRHEASVLKQVHSLEERVRVGNASAKMSMRESSRVGERSMTLWCGLRPSTAQSCQQFDHALHSYLSRPHPNLF